MNDLYFLIAVAFAAVVGWMGWQIRRLRSRVISVRNSLESRTADLETARLQLQRLSTEDPLTALANHEQFLEFIEREWRRGRRDGSPVSVVFLDIDHFRSYNRQFGRRAGDECLKLIGRALEGLAGRAGDLAARYHRDEFAFVLPSTDAVGATRIAERVRHAIEALEIPAADGAAARVVTASIAVASAVPKIQSTWEELDLIKVARGAMREARAQGGNRVCCAVTDGVAVTPRAAIAD